MSASSRVFEAFECTHRVVGTMKLIISKTSSPSCRCISFATDSLVACVERENIIFFWQGEGRKDFISSPLCSRLSVVVVLVVWEWVSSLISSTRRALDSGRDYPRNVLAWLAAIKPFLYCDIDFLSHFNGGRPIFSRFSLLYSLSSVLFHHHHWCVGWRMARCRTAMNFSLCSCNLVYLAPIRDGTWAGTFFLQY